ncbi:hypothetical protein FNB79_15385 [Formosa sediminum]|uniref:DUF6876 domain-containing protein n=1 Tax=Formosa sediminum TaxID=2594004 RepID=A0A516GUX5_9FLAO|nr:DUF6876 family protein [Formosa sediminum]QDO95295.1 hypothetical protein FNB79_15385 [Formosa sediminum]
MNTQGINLEASLNQFTGSMRCYKMTLSDSVITEGIKYLAENGRCFWLISDASIVAKNLMDKSHFITIDFKRLCEAEQKRQGYEAHIVYSDGNDNILETQTYRVTDFPLQKIRLYFVNNTLMLPSEY